MEKAAKVDCVSGDTDTHCDNGSKGVYRGNFVGKGLFFSGVVWYLCIKASSVPQCLSV